MMEDLRFAEHFLFTQQSLLTFDNCPLKFKKRYLDGLKWDAFLDEKIKRRIEQGNNFHLLAHRYFMDIPLGLNESTEESNDLYDWMESLKREFPKEPSTVYLPEYKLRMVTPSLKLEANFDLIMINEDKVQIWDWKTHEDIDRKNRNALIQRLEGSLQTKVYLFMLKEQYQIITGKPIDSERISMCYWQPDKPHLLTKIKYDDNTHERFRAVLENKIKIISEYDYSNFDKALFKKHCRFCEFNWFCNNEGVNSYESEENGGMLED